MSNTKIVLIAILAGFFNTSSFASETSNESDPCIASSVRVLEHCLKDNDNDCWEKSKAMYRSCYEDRINRPFNRYDRIDMEKKRKEEYERLRKKEEELAKKRREAELEKMRKKHELEGEDK